MLGISAFYHDSAAVLLKDGVVVRAAEEERFSRIKHDNAFPFAAIDFCLRDIGITIADVERVVYYEKPLRKFERVFENFVQTYPFSLRAFIKGMPEWLDEKIKVEYTIREKIGHNGEVLFVPHHLSHAAAAFYPSPFKKAAILTIDGVGEYQTTGLWLGAGGEIIPLEGINFPHSVGLLYSTFTSFLGFRVNEDEYKVMGLSAYGTPSYIDKIYQIIERGDDGSFALVMKYFDFRKGFRMWSGKFEALFGEARAEGEEVGDRHADIAASIQRVTEELYFSMLKYLYERTQCDELCVGGGVALNALANGKIFTNTPFQHVYIFGAAGDSGGALGASFFASHAIDSHTPRTPLYSLALGSSYTNEEIESVLKKNAVSYTQYTTEEGLVEEVSRILAEENVIGWFQGSMEFGPRALGSRSILASPVSAKMKGKVNDVKRREHFRPFAGSILEESVDQYFSVPNQQKTYPFMTFCFSVQETKKEKLAAIVHADGSCRVQTVTPQQGRYYRLIASFGERTGVPCILNTSFNVKGEPIVETPQQAVDDFMQTELDYLVIGDFIVTKQ